MSEPHVPTFLSMGFRPFFLGAALFALVTMSEWFAVYSGVLALPLAHLSASQWHAHEMIYGYAIAVVAGFLLTAVSNWTGRPTARGAALGVLVGLWAGARASLLAGDALAGAAALLDGLFALGLLLAVGVPLVRARQWRQAGILAKLLLLATGNVVFWLGAFGVLQHGVRWGLLGGLYLLVSLVLTIGARVLPGFIERGVDYPVRIAAPAWIVGANIVLVLAFFVNELFVGHAPAAVALAGTLCALNAWRLACWHTRGIWRRPLLWGLYGAFAGITAGFGLHALAALGRLPPMLALHAFAIGGVALATLAMMARVALGHTGRDIHAPPAAVKVALGLLLAALLARVGMPLIGMDWYAAGVQWSQGLWIAAFAIFLLAYVPVFTGPRVDAQGG